MALICGFCADIISFMLFPTGAFFFGYTLSAMLGAFIFGLFLWDTRITVVKLVFSRVMISGLINILLGSVWTTLLYSKGFWFYVTKSAIKNIALLPFEIFICIVLFRVLLPILYRRQFTKSQNLTII